MFWDILWIIATIIFFVCAIKSATEIRKTTRQMEKLRDEIDKETLRLSRRNRV